MSERIIRASEIGQYDYCAQAWWLGAVAGVQPSNVRELQAGAAAHQAHGRQVNRTAWMQQGAIGLLVMGVVLLALFLIGNGF
jgi:hypothetical protein